MSDSGWWSLRGIWIDDFYNRNGRSRGDSGRYEIELRIMRDDERLPFLQATGR
jgi:hypothetical protein